MNRVRRIIPEKTIVPLSRYRMVRQIAQPKPEWVKVRDITKRTGWTCEELRRARENDYIKFERRADGIWYNANSLGSFHLLPEYRS